MRFTVYSYDGTNGNLNWQLNLPGCNIRGIFANSNNFYAMCLNPTVHIIDDTGAIVNSVTDNRVFSNSYCYGVTTDNSSNIYIHGVVYTSTYPGNPNLPSTADGFVTKIAPNGTVFWTNQFGSNNTSFAYFWDSTESENIFVRQNIVYAVAGAQITSNNWATLFTTINATSGTFINQTIFYASLDVSYGYFIEDFLNQAFYIVFELYGIYFQSILKFCL